MCGDHPQGAPLRHQGLETREQQLRLSVVNYPRRSVAGQLGTGPVVLGHLEPDPGEGVGRAELQSVPGLAAVTRVISVRHNQGGGRPVEKDNLIELKEKHEHFLRSLSRDCYHEWSSLQQSVLQLTIEEAAPLAEDESSITVLQIQLLQETLSLGLWSHEDLGLNMEKMNESESQSGKYPDLWEELGPAGTAEPVLQVGCDDGGDCAAQLGHGEDQLPCGGGGAV